MKELVFDDLLRERSLPPLRRRPVRTLQINLTLRCNLACHHCHVESSPKRTEAMDEAVLKRVLELLDASPQVRTVDITGGAPEMHPGFRDLVRNVRARGLDVIDRCNLTILFEPEQEDLAQFLADEQVVVIASLPCYTKENVEKQRGRFVFDKSIEALRWLNRLGYGQPDSSLRLDLVYNPLGPSLPPPQGGLEAQYKKELRELFGIEFHSLLTITNMPIKRFGDLLRRRGEYDDYRTLLAENFNPEAVGHVMCRDLVSVAHDGALFDCDFNQALSLPIGGRRRTLWDIRSLDDLCDEPIATGEHCLGCTAGAGSSCGGALT